MKPEPTDHDLRQALRQGASSADSEALQARVLAQWQQQARPSRDGATQRVGAAQLALARWRDHPLRWWLPAALLGSALLLAWCARPDPGLQELMQPDVLSQIAIGEL